MAIFIKLLMVKPKYFNLKQLDFNFLQLHNTKMLLVIFIIMEQLIKKHIVKG